MGKREKDLWDDSALICAFHDAISKYKIKHNRAGGVGSPPVNSSAAVEDESEEARRHEQTNDDSKVLSTKTIEVGQVGETSTVSPSKENSCADASGLDPSQDKPTSYANSQSLEDYNSLLNKYYELEDQRQKVLQQLNQFGEWNYEYPGSSTLPSQEHQTYVPQASNSTLTSFYCPYGCYSSVTPFMTSPACCVGGNCIDKNFGAALKSSHGLSSTSLQQPDVVKTAMDSAEKALSSLRDDLGNDTAAQMTTDHVEKESKSETDLSEVLHAWYSAGVYTGKYLSEQSRARKHHD